MNILELDQYSLDDAIKFHDRLNPGLWGRNEHLLPEVRKQLLAIADDFKEFLGVPDLKLKDITISGSNAAYTYTDHSDIDLHLVVDMPDDAVYQELFNAKKYQYNDEHDIKIRGADVELYVQPADQPHVSQGIYSIVNDQWLQVPKRKRAHVDHSCVQSKTQDLVARIENAIQSQDFSRIDRLWHKIKTMRQNGLQQHGEFGCDNLAFKLLRNLGQLDQLRKAKFQARDQDLSLTERQKKKTVYGFSDYWYPGTAYAGQDHPAGSQGSESREVKESVDPTTVSNFVQEILDFVDLKNPPEIRLHNDPEWSETNKSFGRFTPETHSIDLTICHRHILDILRTLAHELTHAWQYEQEAVPDEAGETGSPWEDHANAMAGRIMRYMADRHPELFAQGDLNEGASGYIPKNKREAAMPQYSMALSVDVKPGETGRQANKLNLQTDAQGRPELLMPGLANALREYKEANRTQYNNRDLNEPRGPETPPKMPAGTIKVDVSDMYDWYKLGQKISDLSSIDKSTLGKGPPSTVFAFGSEDLENMYSHELTKLGLKTHDLDEPGEEDIDESVDDSTGNRKLVSAILKTVPQAQEIWFYGSRARGDHKKTSDWDFLVIVPDDVVGSDFLDMQLALDNLQQHFPNHDIQAAHSWTGLYGSAKQEGQRIWKQSVAEGTLDESLAQPYELIDWDHLDPDKPVTTWAALPDGTDLVIEFEREYPFHNDWLMAFKRGGSIAKTGQGKAPRIFATVLLAIKQFIKRQRPNELSFSAIKHEDEAGSRRSLYDALAKKYAAGLGYSLNVKDDTYQQHYIFKKIKPEVAESQLDEIGYSDKLGDLSVPHEKIIAGATKDGTISQKPVMKYEQGNATLFFFVDNGNISALVLIADGNKLRAIKNFTGQSGQVFALINYIVNLANLRLTITPDEPLTKEGFSWIAKLIKKPSGLKITDLNGNPIDIDGLRKEWLKSKSTQGTKSGNTGIVISESSQQWKTKLQENESRLMPHIYFDVSDNKKQGVAESLLNEFVPGDGSDSGRWYTDDQMIDIVGPDWATEDNVGHLTLSQLLEDAQDWLDDHGYSVIVENVEINPDGGYRWKIYGEFYNPRISQKDKGIKENTIRLSSQQQAKDWIGKVYAKYPQTWQNNHVIPLGGTGGDQQFAFFELVPSMSKRNAVEIKWFQAYPLRQGMGSQAMKILQTLAAEDNIALTLFPWDKGQISQSKLIKFYKKLGFTPVQKGSRSLVWEPVQGVAEGTNRQPLDFDSLYGQAFKITDNNGDPKNPGFSIVTPLNGAAWHWRERPEFKAIVKQKLNDPGFIGDHKYQQIVDAMSGSDFDPHKHTMKGVAESDEDDSKKLKGFHQSLGNAVRGRVSQMQANMAILKAQNPNTWLWEPGDIVYSTKTGRTYEIVGPWLDSRGTAKYLYRGNDEEQGTFVADRAHQTLKKISGKQGLAESQTAKAGIVQTEVYGTRAYHAKCMEPGCDWESRRYDKIKQAQAAAKKHSEQHFNKKDVSENFADGRKPGRKGLAKRVGVNCKQPVSKLRSIAKNSSGERQRMAHWCANMKAGRQKAHESLDEVRIDNKNGIGQMPFNDSIDYHGLRVYTTPKIFLALSLPLSMDEQDRKIIEFLKTQKDTTGFGAPYLEIAIPEQWEAGDFQQPARIVDHDGRHRMMAILETEGNNLVETHLRARYFKNRNLTADIIKHLNQKVVSQNKKILNGPWFKPALPQINEASGTGDYHLWGGRVRVKNADFDNAVDVAVWAKTAFMAQTLLRAQYGKNAVITNVKKVA